MPAIAPILAIGGSLLGGIGKSGKQGGVDTTQQTHQQTAQDTLMNMLQNWSQQQQGQQAGQQTAQTTEDPLISSFRNQLMPQISGAIRQAQQPVYGQAQVADYMRNLNDLANASVSNLSANLARRGAMSGGNLAEGLSAINTGRLGSAAGFMSQIPLWNAQLRNQALPNFFGAANALTAGAPRGQTSQFTGTQQQTGMGQQTGQQTGHMTGTTDATGTTQQTQQGVPWWKTFLGNLGGGMAGAAGGMGKGGGPTPSGPIPTGGW